MNKLFTLATAALCAAASLSSCSRANYTFQPGTGAYHAAATGQATPVTEAPAAPDAAEKATAPELTASAVPVAAAPARPVMARPAVAPVAAAAEHKAASRAEQKARHRDIKQAVKQVRKSAAAPGTPAAAGKSQLTALLLSLFLGFLGVHRFYLGYTGMGILYVGLLLTSWLVLPFFALAILVTVDVIRILTGGLQPKGGEYETKMNL